MYDTDMICISNLKVEVRYEMLMAAFYLEFMAFVMVVYSRLTKFYVSTLKYPVA